MHSCIYWIILYLPGISGCFLVVGIVETGSSFVVVFFSVNGISKHL